MSRCFPFPPPGYEKKRIVEHITLLAKEKDIEKKEKKHKKHKDKDKKDGKQKDKEKSERHKEKDKDKVKDKKKEKKRSRHERSSEGDRSNVEKIGSNSPKNLCAQELEQRVSFLAGATGSQTLHKVYDGDQPKVLNSVSRSNGSYNTEGKSGNDQLANRQRDNSRSSSPKIAFVFRNGTEQRTVHTGKPMESNIKKSTEGKETQKYHFSNKNGENIKNAKRHKGEAEIRTPQIIGYNGGAQIDPFKEAAVVQEFERRIKDENGATGSQVGTKANALIQNKAQNFGKVPNGYVISFSQAKENPKIENGSHNMENGRSNGNQSKSPKVAIVHNFKVEERGREAVRAVDSSKKSLVEESERNVYSAKGVVDNRKKIQSKNEDRNKPREENVKGESGDNVVLSRFGQNGSDSAGSSKTFTLSMSKKNAEAITGKRKEPEANGTVHDNEIRPKKWQKTVVSTQPAVENGRHLKSGTTITFSASKQVPPNGITVNADNQRPNWTVDAQSLPVTKKYPPDSLKPMGTSPPGMTKPPISGKAYGKVHQGSFLPLGLTKPQSSIPVTTGSRDSPLVPAKPPLTTVIHEPPPIVIPKVHETVAFRESSKLASTPGKINGIHEIVSCQESAKPLSTAVGVNGIHDSAKPPLAAGKVNGILEAHVSPAVTLKRPSTSGKEKRKDKSSSKPPPPHPDTKFLSQILSVPKMEELSEFDEPEWLFKSKSVSSKESSAGHDRDRGEQVWAKAVQIESADVYALPYVIPY